MKKISKFLLVLVVALLLVGCEKEEGKESGNTVAKAFNKTVAKENIGKLKFNDSEFTFSEDKNFDNSDAIKVYGVDTGLMDESLYYLASDVVDPSMFIVAKVSDDNKAVFKYQIKDMFEKYYNAYNNYYPKEAKMINDRLEKEYEGYLIYVVSYDNNSVYQAIVDSFK